MSFHLLTIVVVLLMDMLNMCDTFVCIQQADAASSLNAQYVTGLK